MMGIADEFDEWSRKTSLIAQLQRLVEAGSITTSTAEQMFGFQHPPEPTQEEVGAMHGSRQVCPECRLIGPVIVTCDHANKVWVSPKWRAPKKNNDRAWKRIAEGEVNWDHGAIQRKAELEARRVSASEELMKKKRRSAREMAIKVRKS